MNNKKDYMNKIINDNWRAGILYFLLLFLSIILLSRKVDFFVDEILTYNLANSRDLFEPINEVTYSPASKPFVDAFSSKGKINLGTVWAAQKDDTHPPFYYVLVHLICCLFPGTVSIRYAGMVNVLFMLLTFGIYRKILKLIIEDETVVYLLSAMFVLSVGLLSMISLLRMYIMAMFWVTLFSYLIIRHIDKYSPKDFILFFAVTLSGALTHYYCIAYCFFISVCIVIICALQKRFKEIVAYVVSMSSAGVASVLIFPAMLSHIFKEERGTESFSNLADSDFVDRIKSYFGSLDKEIFGGAFGIILVVLFFVSIAIFYQKNEQKSDNETNKKQLVCRYICILVPSICYFLLVAKSSPFFSERYISPIFALVLAGVMGVIYRVIKKVINREDVTRLVVAGLASVMILGGLKDYDWQYLFRERKNALEAAENKGGSDSNAICIYSRKWMIDPHYLEISKCGTVTFYQLTDYDSFAQKVNDELFGEKLALFIIGDVEGDFFERFISDYPEYTMVCDNGEWGYGHSYYFVKNK